MLHVLPHMFKLACVAGVRKGRKGDFGHPNCIPSLLNRRLQDIVILMYKVKYRLVPDFICGIFSTKSCKYNFRNQNFDIPRFNSVLYGNHSLRYLGPLLWNKLDKNITESSSLSRFKFHIRSKDLTELISGNNCSACVICTS